MCWCGESAGVFGKRVNGSLPPLFTTLVSLNLAPVGLCSPDQSDPCSRLVGAGSVIEVVGVGSYKLDGWLCRSLS